MGQDGPTQAARRLALVKSTWAPGDTGGLATCRSALLAEAAVAHAFTLRPHNMRAGVGNDGRRVDTPRERLCAALGGEPSNLTSMEQVHGSQIAPVGGIRCGGRVDGVDGLIADRTGVMLMALSADCPVIAVCEPHSRVLGLVHAGWRGTIRHIARKLVDMMIEQFGCRPQNLVAAIAPSAGPCCYQVGDEVVHQAAALPEHERHFVHRDGAVFFDMWSANVTQLCEAGISPERIDLAGRCTVCDQRFFSYRRDGAATGHAAFLTMLR